MYVITGATGNSGRVVAERLLSLGQKVRVIGRSKDRLQTLVDQGAEPYVCGLEDQPNLARAFSGAKAVYAMIPPNYQAPEVQAYQLGIADSLARAIEEANVKHVVFLSSAGAHQKDGLGPITGPPSRTSLLFSPGPSPLGRVCPWPPS